MLRKQIQLLLAISALALLSTVRSNGEVIINEVMSNEPGRETALEWIELWNFGDTAISMDGYSIVNESDTVSLEHAGLIEGKEFLVLARDVMRFEEHWGNCSGIWGDSITESYNIIPVGFSLRNDYDTLILIRDDDTAVSLCAWSSSSPDGVSLERVDPRETGDEVRWAECIHPDRSTPGAFNSVSPAENDLSLSAEIRLTGQDRDFIEAEFTVANVGLSVSDTSRIWFGVDSICLDTDEVVFSRHVPSLPPGESFEADTAISVSPGRLYLIATIRNDDRPENNDTLCQIVAGTQPIDIVINELLPDPCAPLETEWLELHNISGKWIDLSGWVLCDASGCAEIPGSAVESGGFVILCQDSDAFGFYYDAPQVDIIELPDWQTLNNTGDTLYLIDNFGCGVDSMYYETTFAQNVSIERIDPFAAGYTPSNWYRSTSESGSTPGELNSVLNGFSSSVNVELSDNIISPDGDGIDDYLTISYRLLKDSQLTLRVFDIEGRVVRTILDDKFTASGVVTYDGTDDSGNPLELGMYILLAEVEGASNVTKKLVFAVAGRK